MELSIADYVEYTGVAAFQLYRYCMTEPSLQEAFTSERVKVRAGEWQALYTRGKRQCGVGRERYMRKDRL